MTKYLGLLLLWFVPPFYVQAQREMANWTFGNQASVSFASGINPIVAPLNTIVFNEASATLSDSLGNLLFYCNGEVVCDRTGIIMPNGRLTGGNTSASQGALLLPAPGQPHRYYLFTVPEVGAGATGEGLRYSVLDGRLRGGLGDVITGLNSIAVPLPSANAGITERLTAVLHANSRDYWIIIHGWQPNAFYGYLLSPSGLASVPVVSPNPIFNAGSAAFNANAQGCMKASPNGRLLALTMLHNATAAGIELFDFNNGTGQLTPHSQAPVPLGNYYGLEFSSDNSKLYLIGDTIRAVNDTRRAILQVAFQAAGMHESAAGPVISNTTVGLQRGPDGKIYFQQFSGGAAGLCCIPSPNNPALTCGYQYQFFSVMLPFRSTAIGLPNFPNAWPGQLITSSMAASQQPSRLGVAPNPAHDRVTVQFPLSFGNSIRTVNLIDCVGQTVRQQQMVINAKGAGQFAVDGLLTGMYVIQCVGSEGGLSQRLVVE